jgi:shikimate kinase
LYEVVLSQHIYLTGYRGTGKTTVGALIASKWPLPLVDLDKKIEFDHAKTIRQIFDEGGEPLFRKFEAGALREVAAGPQSIVSLGGGAIVRKENRELIRQSGVCIWLDATAETLAKRIQNDVSTSQSRPSLTSQGLLEEIAPLLKQRDSMYREVATARIDTTGKSIDQVAAEAIEVLENLL